MAVSILQTAKNRTAYPEVPLDVVLPVPTTAGSLLVALIFAQKTGYPFNVGDIVTQTTTPGVINDKWDTLTLVDDVVDLSQEIGFSPPIMEPDVSGYFPSIYVFSGVATTGAQKVSAASFYPDEVLSPPLSPPFIGTRPVFDGGMEMVVLEVAGYQTGVEAHGNTYSNSATLGASLITPGFNNELVIEAGLLIDGSSIIPPASATYIYSGSMPAGSSSWIVQSTLQTTKAATSGFTNPIQYSGAVVTLAIK